VKEQIKILHTADIHYSRDKQEQALQSLGILADTAVKKRVNLVILAGDLFDQPVNNTENSGFPELISVMQKLMNAAPVIAVTGTPTHDIRGCYEVFKKIDAKYLFRILEAGQDYYLGSEEIVWNGDPVDADKPKLLLFGIPEVSKQHFLKDKQLGQAESDEVIKNGMRELLLGMGAIRKQYPDIPCVLVYHGMVAGATLSNNQVMPAGGIQLGKEDLALVGADYYALGHVHKAQQIDELPAYYSGSAFPVDWGETDQKAFSCVEFKEFYAEAEDNEFADHSGDQWNWKSEVQRIPYPHPPRKKLSTTLREAENRVCYDSHVVEGYQVWLNIKCPKKRKPDTQAFLDDLIKQGALPGSRVTVEIVPVETIRSKEITEVTKLRDKVKINADLSGENVSDSILEKADTLELTAKEEGLTTEGLHIRIKKLILRGAIGIGKGIGKDQIEINFDSFEPGLLALVGINGSGKTTLIENMHPYPQMLTRSGKLQDHFMLRDSFRDLYFVDEFAGTEYRAFMQIDGVNKSGNVEYFLYRNGEPVTNGRKDDYEQKILQLFGSLPLFLRSTFISQKQPKNLPDLSDATKGEKKALFRELGGLDYLQSYADLAKTQVQILEKELISITAKLENKEAVSSEIDRLKEQRGFSEKAKEKHERELNVLKAEGEEIAAKEKELALKVEENNKNRTKFDALQERDQGLDSEEEEVLLSIENFTQARQSKDEAEEHLQQYEKLKAEEAELNAEEAKELREREAIMSEYSDYKETLDAAERSLLDEKAPLEKEMSDIQRKRDVIEERANTLDKELQEPVTENCPTCGQKWPPDKRKFFEDERSTKRVNLTIMQDEIFNADKRILDLNRQIKDTEESISKFPRLEKPALSPFKGSPRLKEIKEELLEYNLDALREIIQKAQEAHARIEELNKREEQIQREKKRIYKEVSELIEKIDEKADEEHKHIILQLENLRQQYAEAQNKLTVAETEIRSINEQLRTLRDQLETLRELAKEAEEKTQDRDEWKYLQEACGPDGIQALELDAMGPSIADVANSILESAYGSRFRIEFRTTRIGGSGSNTKQIEDFLIVIHDSQDGSEQLLETLSGGESIWIKRAIYDAFGIVRSQKTGTKFLTCFMDECDGALDPEARVHYFRMLERAHAESGRHHSIIITHSPDAQETIGQKIEMTKL